MSYLCTVTSVFFRAGESLPRSASSNSLHGYGHLGAFQDINSFWDRPQAPQAPSGPSATADLKAVRPTGGKPDWYNMISDQDPLNRTDQGVLKNRGPSNEVSKTV